MSRLIFFLLFLIIACDAKDVYDAPDELTSEQESLKQRIAEANAKLSSYSYQITTESTNVLGDIETNTNTTTIVEVDTTTQRFHSTAEAFGQTAEIYGVDGFLYQKLNDRWVKDAFNWSDQDQFAGMLDLILVSEVNEVTTPAYHEITLKPNVTRLLQNELSEYQLIENISDMIDNYAITLLISTTTNLVEQAQTNYTFSIYNEILGDTLTQNASVTLQLMNTDEPVEIELPVDAFDAIDLTTEEGQLEMLQIVDELADELSELLGENTVSVESLDYEKISVAGCNDTDGGKNFYVYGNVSTHRGHRTEELEDMCSKNPSLSHKLYEAYCREDGQASRESFDCPNVCENGACIA